MRTRCVCWFIVLWFVLGLWLCTRSSSAEEVKKDLVSEAEIEVVLDIEWAKLEAKHKTRIDRGRIDWVQESDVFWCPDEFKGQPTHGCFYPGWKIDTEKKAGKVRFVRSRSTMAHEACHAFLWLNDDDGWSECGHDPTAEKVVNPFKALKAADRWRRYRVQISPEECAVHQTEDMELHYAMAHGMYQHGPVDPKDCVDFCSPSGDVKEAPEGVKQVKCSSSQGKAGCITQGAYCKTDTRPMCSTNCRPNCCGCCSI